MLKQELLLSSSSQSGECQSTEDLPPCSEATATLSVSPTLPDDTALQSLLFLPSNRAQQLKLSAGDYINWGFAFILDRIQGASIIIFQLIDLMAVPALLLSRALWSKVLIWPFLLKSVLVSVGWGIIVCASSRKDPCSRRCCSECLL